MNHTISWLIKPFPELSAIHIYDLFKLRQDVFIVEQNCIFSDFDSKDQKAFHLLGYRDNQLLAYARLFAVGDYFTDACSFGRIATNNAHRGNGYGKQLVKKTLVTISQRWPDTLCKISAQSHLEQFYGSFGFARVGSPYLEDGIFHIAMLKKPPLLSTD